MHKRVIPLLLLAAALVGGSGAAVGQSESPDPLEQAKQDLIADEQAKSEQKEAAKQDALAEKAGVTPEPVEPMATEFPAGTVTGSDITAIIDSLVEGMDGEGFATVVLIVSAGGDVKIGADSVIEGADADITGAQTTVEQPDPTPAPTKKPKG